jgi:hypothetical protein
MHAEKQGSSVKSSNLLPLTSANNKHLIPLKLKTRIYFFLNIIFLGAISGNSFAQTFTVEVQIKNQPNNAIVFGSVKGDEFNPIDSTTLKQTVGKVRFNFPENAHPGVYRIIFGTTPAARILNEPPQQLDFIFDNENLAFDTDFKAPVENLKIIQSKENTVWFEFLAKYKVIRQNIEMLEKEIDSNWQKGDTTKVIAYANDFNQLQMEMDVFVVQNSQKNPGLFASQMIKNLREPLLDGYLTTAERKQSFQKEFFKLLDFTNPALINSSIYTDNIFKYLVSYNQFNFTQKQREAEYIKALDIIVPNIRQNEQVFSFLMGYLVHGFNVLKMENVISTISKKYKYPQ